MIEHVRTKKRDLWERRGRKILIFFRGEEGEEKGYEHLACIWPVLSRDEGGGFYTGNQLLLNAFSRQKKRYASEGRGREKKKRTENWRCF